MDAESLRCIPRIERRVLGHMALKKCPYCGHEEDDGKIFRLSIFIGDQRIAVIPAGTATFAEIKSIVKATPGSYLMEEVLNANGRISHSRQVAESLMVYTTDGKYKERI
jgi:hypothetical protein